MQSINRNFTFLSKFEVLNSAGFVPRSGEFRMGDYLQSDYPNAKFLILGLSESIGPFANFGRAGAEHAFSSFLKFFLALPYHQTSYELAGNITFAGEFPKHTKEASKLVEELDGFVVHILHQWVKPGQLPILIGGGHNNALPIMQWASSQRPLQKVINIDAHMDCRDTHQRHSGNAFSCALKQGLIQQYLVLGAERYSFNEYILAFIEQFPISYIPFEDYLLGRSLKEDLVQHTSSHQQIGLEIDLDRIANMPSSAQSPSGFSLDQIRSALLSLTTSEIVYLHLCEGAPTNAGEERTVGKALCYMVLDFMKAME